MSPTDVIHSDPEIMSGTPVSWARAYRFAPSSTTSEQAIRSMSS